MSRALLLPLLFLLPLLAACIDFVEVAGPAEGGTPALMYLRVHSESREASHSLEIQGLLNLGTDARLRQRTLANDTLWIAGHPLLPQVRTSDGQRHYLRRWEQSPADSLLIRFPRVRGVSGELPPVRWHPLRRVDPDTVLLPEGSDLVLRLHSGEAASDPPATRTHWSVLLRSRHQFSRIERIGALPATLVLPWSLLPTEDGEIEVTLSALEDHAYEAPAHDYLLQAAFYQQLDWKVRIVPAGAR